MKRKTVNQICLTLKIENQTKISGWSVSRKRELKIKTHDHPISRIHNRMSKLIIRKQWWYLKQDIKILRVLK